MRFKQGDICIYHGPVQNNVLAPGDTVEVVFDLNPGYHIKMDSLYHAAVYTCADNEINYFLPRTSKPFDKAISESYTEVVEKRKSNGECTSCGKPLPMSMFGLLPCACQPVQPVKW